MSNGYNDFFEQLDLFDWFKDVVDTSIHDMLKEKLGFSDDEQFLYQDLSFYPVYTRCASTGEKLLKSLYIKNDLVHDEYESISIDEIEKSGASWEEFVDFMMLSDAKLVYYKNIL